MSFFNAVDKKKPSTLKLLNSEPADCTPTTHCFKGKVLFSNNRQYYQTIAYSHLNICCNASLFRPSEQKYTFYWKGDKKNWHFKVFGHHKHLSVQ